MTVSEPNERGLTGDKLFKSQNSYSNRLFLFLRLRRIASLQLWANSYSGASTYIGAS